MLGKLNTSAKLYLLIFITAASLIGLGLYGIDDLKKMNENTETLYKDRVVCMQQLSNIRRVYRGDIRALAQSVKIHELSFSEAKKRIQQAQEIIDTNWHNYKLTNFTQEEKLLVKQTDILKNKADEATQNLISILSKGDTLALNKLVQEENAAVSAPFAVKVTQLMDLQVRVAKEILVNNKILYQVTSRNFILLILLTLAVALSLSFYIIKNVRVLIKDLLRSNNEIKESEKRYRSILENASDAIYLMNNEGSFIEVNDSMCEMLGYTKDELLAFKIEDVFDNKQLKTDPVDLSLLPYQSTFKQTKFIRKDGTVVEVEIHGKRLDENKLIGIARDITERKQTEQLILKEKELSETIINSLPGLFYLRDANGKALGWNKNVETVIGFSADEINGAVLRNFVAEEDRETMRIAAERTFSEGYSSVEVNVVTKEGEKIPYLLTGRPIVYENQLCLLGTGIDISQRIKAEEELRSSEQKYRFLFESNPVPLTMVAKDDLSIIAINEAAAGLYGYTVDELLHSSASIVRLKEDLEAQSQFFRTEVTGPTEREVVRHVKKDGTIIFVRVIVNDITFNGRAVRLVMSTDVTEKLKAEELLKQSEARFRGAFENASIGVALVSLKGEWLEINDTLCEMLGYDENELLQLTFQQITHPDDVESGVEFLRQTITGETDNYRVEKRYVRKDGSIVWANLNVSAIRGPDKQVLYFLAVIENITEKIESQIKFQNLVENFIVSVYIHQNGKIVYVNPRALEESGFTEEDLIGKPFEQFIYKDDQDLVKKITEAREKEQIDTVRYEARFVKKDGQPLWYEMFGSRTVYQGAPALMGTMINVTERKAVYDELKKSEANLRSIFDITDISYLLLDANFNIVALNQNMKDIYQDNVGVMLKEGDNLIELILPERRQRMRELYGNVLKSKKPGGYETSFINGGVTKHFSASVIPIIVGNKATGLCISSIDVTERKNALEKLKEANENLKKHAKELAISNAELEQFAYVASHDLQEPLRMVTSFLTQLEKKYGDVVDDRGKQYIYFAVDGAKRMRQIILDLLDFSRVGRTEDDLEEVNFNKLVNEVLALYRRQIEELQASIGFENLPTLQTYKTPMRQVFQNLIGNSLKYHQTDVAPVISITCKETKAHFQFSIKDNGIGISPEYFDRIFIIFQRLHNKDEYSGTGMGLAITKKIIETLGGKIWVESSEGNGSTFHFTISKNNKS